MFPILILKTSMEFRLLKVLSSIISLQGHGFQSVLPESSQSAFHPQVRHPSISDDQASCGCLKAVHAFFLPAWLPVAGLYHGNCILFEFFSVTVEHLDFTPALNLLPGSLFSIRERNHAYIDIF